MPEVPASQVGAVTLGPSVTAPQLTAWIDNSGGASWMTLENRLALPVGVVPAYSSGSPDQPVLFTIPGLTRSTVPIDPAKGVQLTVQNGLQAAGLNSPSPLTVNQVHVKRQLPYMLHDAGGAPSEPLYPVEALVPAVLNVAGGSGTVNLWVGPQAPPAFISALQIFNGPADCCLVAASVLLEPGTSLGQSLSNMSAAFWTDLDAVAPTLGGFEVFTGGDAAGDLATFSCHGCQALQLQVPIAGDAANYTVTGWVGVPAS